MKYFDTYMIQISFWYQNLGYKRQFPLCHFGLLEKTKPVSWKLNFVFFQQTSNIYNIKSMLYSAIDAIDAINGAKDCVKNDSFIKFVS